MDKNIASMLNDSFFKTWIDLFGIPALENQEGRGQFNWKSNNTVSVS